nr:hypothetical protein [Dyella sp. ASV24]
MSLRTRVAPGNKGIINPMGCARPTNRPDRSTSGRRMRRSRQSAVSAMKLHRRTVLCREPLQPCRGARINRAPLMSIGMQGGNMPAISLFQLGQVTARVNAQAAIEIEKVGFVRHHRPPTMASNRHPTRIFRRTFASISTSFGRLFEALCELDTT